MKAVKLLLANFERRTNNLVEVVVRDACFGHGLVECVRTNRIDEFLLLGTRDEFDLIIVAPDHLVPEPSRKTGHVSVDESLRAIRRIKRKSTAPIIAVCAPKAFDLALIEAGAEAALGLFFKPEALELEVRRVLKVPEQVEAPTQVRLSLGAAFLRGLQRLIIPGTQ